MNVVFLLLDSLNRAYLGPYRDPDGPYSHVDTRNFDRLAERACTFENHWITSTPCMPARRDLWTGRAEFPWRGWGPLEPWDHTFTRQLYSTSVHTQFFCDHHHMWERGSANYHVDFKGFEFIRGQECDTWQQSKTTPTAYDRGMFEERAESIRYGSGPQYMSNKGGEQKEEEYFSVKTMTAATHWLETHHKDQDPFCLVIDEFDPHEPFDVPDPYRSMYLDDPKDIEKGYTYWPIYGEADRYSPEEQNYIRAQYCGCVTMMDRALGRMLDMMDEKDLWQNTVFIVTTDHGHFLGEYGFLGKNNKGYVPFYANTPLFIHYPNSALNGKRTTALSNMTDLHTTLLDTFGQTPAQPIHGKSLLPILKGEVDSVRDGVLFGQFAGGMYYCDGEHLLCQPATEGSTLYRFGYDFTTPWNRGQNDLYENVESGRYLPYIDVPVLRKEVGSNGFTRDLPTLYHVQQDWWAHDNLWNKEPELRQTLQKKMVQEMKRLQVPEEHYQRLGFEK